jgi:hypothetical protein
MSGYFPGLYFLASVCSPLADTLFHHRLEESSKPRSKIASIAAFPHNRYR